MMIALNLKMTREIKFLLWIGVALLAVIIWGQLTYVSKQGRERAVNDARTRKAVATVMDSIRLELQPIKADLDTLKRWER